MSFNVNDIITPVDIDKVLNDTRLSSGSKKLIEESNCKAVVTQIQDGLVYASYFSNDLDRVTQVYKPEEIKLAE